MEGTAAVDGAACDGIAHGFGDRHRFAGDHTLIHTGTAFGQFTIHCDPLARAHDQNVASDDAVDGHILRLPVNQHTGRLCLKAHQLLDRSPGPALRAGLQPAAQKDQHHDDRRRLEIDRARSRGQQRRCEKRHK